MIEASGSSEAWYVPPRLLTPCGLADSLFDQPNKEESGVRLWPRLAQESGRDGPQGQATQEGEAENRERKPRCIPFSLADVPPGLSSH